MSDMNLEEGEYEGRLVYVTDLGWHQDTYQGEKKKPCVKRVLGIEIPDYPVTFEGKEQPRLLWTKPFNTFGKLTEKGKETEMYAAFEPNFNEEPDWEAQLGKPCSVVVKHVHKNDKTFDNIQSISRIPQKYWDSVTENSIEPHAFDEESKKRLFGLAKWIYENRMGEEEKQQEEKAPTPRDDFEDDLPF